MAINNNTVGDTDTSLFLSVGESAITLMSFCNTSIADRTLSIHIVRNSQSASNSNIFIKDIVIPISDSYIAYQGGEKIILSDGDYISAITDSAGDITAIISYVVI